MVTGRLWNGLVICLIGPGPVCCTFDPFKLNLVRVKRIDEQGGAAMGGGGDGG